MAQVYPILTQLFYNRKDIFQTNQNALDEILAQWMLTPQFISSTLMEEEIALEKAPVQKAPLEKAPIKSKFYPRHPDSLFWCLYVAIHSYTVYETNIAIGTNMTNLMMSVKRELFEYFAGDASTELKRTNHKITNVKMNEIKSDLMTQPALAASLVSLIPCSIYWRRPIYVDLGDKCYLHFVRNDYVADDEGDDDSILLYINKGSYCLELDAETRKKHIANMQDNYYKFVTVEKPICGIGAYKTDELKLIYNKLYLRTEGMTQRTEGTTQRTEGTAQRTEETEKKLTKQAMYEKIAILCGQKLTMKLR